MKDTYTREEVITLLSYMVASVVLPPHSTHEDRSEYATVFRSQLEERNVL